MIEHLSLFNGIGGFQLAAQWAGWNNLASCEIDPFCNKVTKYHFPNCVQHEDIRTTDFTIYRGIADVISGGFTCQPFSQAGKRRGTEDERHLWPHHIRAVREVKPRVVVGENVYGLVNWSGGLVFEMVCADLENEGYQVFPFILPACGKEANHIRQRIWFIALSSDFNKDGWEWGNSKNEILADKRGVNALNDIDSLFISNIPNTKQVGRRKLELQQDSTIGEVRRSIIEERRTHWTKWPVKPTICGDDDGVPNRVDRIEALGNAIDPHVAYEIFNAINKLATS